ncbi:META domain-containing protein, partial [Chloroflexota bacterium]
MKKRFIISLVVLPCMIMVFLAACSSGIAPDPLEGTSWQLFAVRKSSVGGTSITVEFDDGRISGTGGCNSFSGDYELDGDMIIFGEIAMTLMACPEPDGIMEQEQEFLTYLSQGET